MPVVVVNRGCTAPASECRNCVLLQNNCMLVQKANKKITDLKEDIRRLSEELQKKDSLLSSSQSVDAEQTMRIAHLNASLQDTVLWDLNADSRPAVSSSTPAHRSSWSEVVSRRPKRTSPPPLSLSNRYEALSEADPVRPADDVAPPPVPDPAPGPAREASSSRVVSDARTAPRRSQAVTSASRRRILKEAVLRHSVDHHPGPVMSPSPRPTEPDVTTLPSRSSPRPLFSPTTLLVGDSITRNLRYFNVATHCFPGATVPVILEKLPELLLSLPPSIERVIVHIRSNDAHRGESEVTKGLFNKLFNYLKKLW